MIIIKISCSLYFLFTENWNNNYIHNLEALLTRQLYKTSKFVFLYIIIVVWYFVLLDIYLKYALDLDAF
jgi:hypothetical protein